MCGLMSDNGCDPIKGQAEHQSLTAANDSGLSFYIFSCSGRSLLAGTELCDPGEGNPQSPHAAWRHQERERVREGKRAAARAQRGFRRRCILKYDRRGEARFSFHNDFHTSQYPACANDDKLVMFL